MIRGICVVSAAAISRCTGKEDWPEVFAALPRIGDSVRASTSGVRLTVTAVVHCTVSGESEPEPFIEVELA